MASVEHIVVGLDSEAQVHHAIAAGVRLSKHFPAKLEVVHAVQMKHPSWWNENQQEWAEALAEVTSKAREVCEKKLQEILAMAGAADVDAGDVLHVLEGRPSETLVARATEHAPALIVLGPHRERGMFDLGGTTREVLRHLPCPLWLQTREWEDIERILVPVDLSPGSSAIFEVAQALAAALRVDLEVIYCFEPPRASYGFQPKFLMQDYRKTVATHLKQFMQRVAPDGKVASRLVDGEPARTILELQGAKDLVVMGTHGHSAFTQVMLGSQAQKILRRSTHPVVVVPLAGGEGIA